MMRTQAEKDQRRREYRAYLKSPVWKAVRQAAIYRAGGVCEWCKGADLLQVHHVRYPEVFGREEPEDLKVLCDPCHAEAHGRPYIIHKLARAKLKARKRRLWEAGREEREAARAKKRAERKRRSARFKPREPTPPLKDRF